MSFFGKAKPRPPEDPRVTAAKQLDGSLVVGIGPSGCGKTDSIERLSMACAYHANDGKGIPWYAYDANGDVRKHLRGVKKYLRRVYDETGDRGAYNRLRFVHNVSEKGIFFGPDALPKLIDSIMGWVDTGMGKLDADDPRSYMPRAVLFLDEAGAIRQKDEKFWPTMRMARNAGLTLFSTGHRLKDWHPAALAVIRAALLWQHPIYDPYDINGLHIPRSVCAKPKSDILKYIVGSDPHVYTWTRAKPGYPAELLIPAQPTRPREAGF
jgi:hypothetical protein